MREDFSALRVPEDVSAAFPPDRDALLDLIRPLVSGEALEVVAGADYGRDYEAHLAELRRLRSGETVGQPLAWEPIEVLELYRWSEEPDDPRVADPRAFHLTRAFCAAALLRSTYSNGEARLDVDCLGPLLESCLELGGAFLTSLLRLIVWSLDALEPWDVDYLFYAFALVVGHAFAAPEEGARTERLGEWFVSLSAETLPWHSGYAGDGLRTFLDVPCQTILTDRYRRLALRAMERVEAGTELRRAMLAVSTGGPKP